MNLIVFGKALPRLLPTRLIMQINLTALFILVLSLHISARSFSQQVTISGKALTLDRVFDEIENQTGYQFVYDNALLKKVKPVTLDLRGATIEEALTQCLKGQPFAIVIQDKIITI